MLNNEALRAWTRILMLVDLLLNKKLHFQEL
jgi:hypothetical protein